MRTSRLFYQIVRFLFFWGGGGDQSPSWVRTSKSFSWINQRTFNSFHEINVFVLTISRLRWGAHQDDFKMYRAHCNVLVFFFKEGKSFYRQCFTHHMCKCERSQYEYILHSPDDTAQVNVHLALETSQIHAPPWFWVHKSQSHPMFSKKQPSTMCTFVSDLYFDLVHCVLCGTQHHRCDFTTKSESKIITQRQISETRHAEQDALRSPSF